MALTINYTRLTTSDKLSDRFLTCQAYSPIDPEQAQKGMLFSQIEILNPWFPTSQIGQTVINTLIREYYRGTNSSDLINFENAVKKVNESLAQIAQNGETEWIGKFNGVLALVNGQEIHFAQSGMSHAYLYRSGKINHITEGLDSDEAPHPLKTFSNLTSGSLQQDDKIVIGNAIFFDQIKPLELKNIVGSFHSATSAIESAKILKLNGAHDANAIFMELTTKEELANIPPDQKTETVYIDQLAPQVSAIFGNFFHKVFIPGAVKLGGLFSRSSKAAIKKLAPAVRQGYKITKDSASKAVQNIGSRPKKQTAQDVSTNPEDQSPKNQRVEVKAFFYKTKNKLRRFLIQAGLYSRQKSKMVLAILIIFLLILGGTITFLIIRHQTAVAQSDQQAKVEQITSLDGDAAVMKTKGNLTQALSDYKQIIALANSLSGTKFSSQVAPTLLRAQSSVTDITKLKNVSSTASFDFASGTDIVACNQSIIGVQKDGSINKVAAGLTKIGTLSSGEIASSTCLDDKNQVAYLGQDKNLTLFSIGTKTTSKAGNTSSNNKIVQFGDNLYQLDVTQNQIWKLANTNNIFGTASAYLKDSSVTLANTVDFAIDGSVYTLSNKGEVARYSRGIKNNSFNIQLPAGEVLSGWSNLFTSENTNSLFAVSNESGNIRVVELKKTGEFVAQFSLNNISTPSKIIMQPDLREISVYQNSKVVDFKI